MLAYLVSIFSLHAQTLPSCHGAVSNDFALMASSERFVKSHDAPLKYTYQGKGETITFTTPDGKEGSGFLIKNKKPTNNYIFVFQECGD